VEYIIRSTRYVCPWTLARTVAYFRMAAAPFFLVLTYLSKVSTLATDHVCRTYLLSLPTTSRVM
jgi:hypothetical protein